MRACFAMLALIVREAIEEVVVDGEEALNGQAW